MENEKTKKYNMAIIYKNNVIYKLNDIEAHSVEEAREIIWDTLIEVAYADEYEDETN